MKSRIAAGGAAGAAILVALAAPLSASAATADTAQLTVFHGIPDTPVDVYVNGDLTLDDFEPGTVTDELSLPAGDYALALTAPDAESADDPILEADVTLAAGANYTAAAHLTEGGDPALAAFENDISATAAGEGRLTVRHAAAAPAVDVLAGGDAVVSDLSNPNEAILDLAASTVSASVAATGTTEALIGPADVPITEGVNTIVYAWGSLDDDNLDLAVQTVEGLHTPPAGIPAGQTGEAAALASSQSTWFGVGALGLMLAAAGAFFASRRSAARR
ncbi:DUF4397 domain-containing protein [Marisediminicola sp. LYQ134]|uniref:DUF4397 domain-containing protein n=1 Tax=unclassified Marisediminicola TaxID=2618316 RepID=UPI003983A37C